MDLWQSPKSKPQIFKFLSIEPVTIRSPSDEISIHSTGSLWPYKERKNLSESIKKTCKGHRKLHQNDVTDTKANKEAPHTKTRYYVPIGKKKKKKKNQIIRSFHQKHIQGESTVVHQPFSPISLLVVFV